MKLNAWYKKRGFRFVLERAQKLNERYNFNPWNTIDRIDCCMDKLREFNCYPTFAVPGMVVEHNNAFIRRLQAAGAEIAVHGYNHVDMKAYPPEEASRQLKRGVDVFRVNNLEVHGFRCPYLSLSDELLKAIPPGLFEYSSNKAIQWLASPAVGLPESLLFDTIKSFYTPVSAESAVCLPWFQDMLVEIPVCVPDDLQLHDGLGYGLEQISQVWLDILHQTHRRGELFNLMFHPELAAFCEIPFLTVLQEAISLRPRIWLAQLHDISAWWKEKAAFSVETALDDGIYHLTFHCTPRATLLCRGFDPKVPTKLWDEDYYRVDNWSLRIDSSTLPFIGLPPSAPHEVVTALRGIGYILETGENATQCSLYIDETTLSKFYNLVDLISYIEHTHEPMIRFWPWPDGARSALCISGDLDALSFVDYARRLWCSK